MTPVEQSARSYLIRPSPTQLPASNPVNTHPDYGRTHSQIAKLHPEAAMRDIRSNNLTTSHGIKAMVMVNLRDFL